MRSYITIVTYDLGKGIEKVHMFIKVVKMMECCF